jgi:hypothetical protein
MADDKDKKTTRRSPFDSGKSVPPGTPPRVTSRHLNSQSDPANFWFDPSDFYANNFENFIQFTSVISKKSVKFKAFLTSFEDQFKSDWNSEQVYGRNDPIQTFRNTTRTINLGWDCPAGSITEGEANSGAAALLIRMLYPSYIETGNVSTINKAPLIKVRFRNLVKGYDDQELLVTIDGINFSPDLEAGWFDEGSIMAANSSNVDELIPKLLRFSCTMTVLHKTTIGYKGQKWPDNLSAFPNLPAWKDPTRGEHFLDSFGGGGAAYDTYQTSFNEEEERAKAALDAAQAELDTAREMLDLEKSEQQAAREATRREKSAVRQTRKAQRMANKVQRGMAPLPVDDLGVESANPGTYAEIDGLPRYPGDYEDLGE